MFEGGKKVDEIHVLALADMLGFTKLSQTYDSNQSRAKHLDWFDVFEGEFYVSLSTRNHMF